VRHLVQRVKRGISWAREEAPSISQLVVAGGVASNLHVRAQLQAAAEEAGMQLRVPSPKYCTDNGVMVAWAGHERATLGLVQAPAEPLPAGLEASSEWIELRPRWPLTSDKHSRASTQQLLSMKSASKMAPSLTDMTAAEVQLKQGSTSSGVLL